MTLRTFTWFPDQGSSLDIKPAIASTKFGDGYEQRMPQGINSMPQLWQVSFSRSRSEVAEILQFLKEHGGYKPFSWTTPHGETGTYICRQFAQSNDRAMSSARYTFEQVFDPS